MIYPAPLPMRRNAAPDPADRPCPLPVAMLKPRGQNPIPHLRSCGENGGTNPATRTPHQRCGPLCHRFSWPDAARTGGAHQTTASGRDDFGLGPQPLFQCQTGELKKPLKTGPQPESGWIPPTCSPILGGHGQTKGIPPTQGRFCSIDPEKRHPVATVPLPYNNQQTLRHQEGLT